MKSNDYVNCIVQALLQVMPIRRFFLLQRTDTRVELGLLFHASKIDSRSIWGFSSEVVESKGI